MDAWSASACAAAVTLPGAQGVSAPAGRARHAGHRAETPGRPLGRPKGSSRGPATRYPAIKKPTSKPRKNKKKATTTAKAA